MSRARQLNQRQQRRIQQRRQADDQTLTSELQPGLVITNFGKRLLVEAENGELINCAVRQHLGKLVAGDRVFWQPDIEAGTGIVSEFQPRKSELSRPGFRGQKRMVAANIDLICIIAPIEPGVHPDMIDRYLVAAAQLKLPAVILINKVDLLTSEQDWEDLADLLLPYEELEIEIIPVSAHEDDLAELKILLSDLVSAFVGPSGAGKSSLINALIPDANIRTSALSEATGLGVHTTTNSIYYQLPGEIGAIIDTPGVRLFSPAPCSLSELESYYPDFAPFIGKCKFDNCSHTNEPDCAILQALQDEEIAYSRYHSFQRLMAEFNSIE